MVGGGTTAGPDDAGPGPQSQFDVFAHTVGPDRVGEAPLGLVKRNAAVGFGDRHRRRSNFGDAVGRSNGVTGADPAVGSNGSRSSMVQPPVTEGPRVNPHHRVTGGVEAQGGRVRESGGGGTGASSLQLFERGDRLDPEHVRPRLGQSLTLLGKDLDSLFEGERSERCEQLAGGAHAPGDRNRAAGLVGCVAGGDISSSIEFVDS